MEHLFLCRYFDWVLVPPVVNGESVGMSWGREDDEDDLEVTGKQDVYGWFDIVNRRLQQKGVIPEDSDMKIHKYMVDETKDERERIQSHLLSHLELVS